MRALYLHLSLCHLRMNAFRKTEITLSAHTFGRNLVRIQARGTARAATVERCVLICCMWGGGTQNGLCFSVVTAAMVNMEE